MKAIIAVAICAVAPGFVVCAADAPKMSHPRPKAVTINAADLLPASKAYYTFAGSLTTPPCTEGVTWFVLKSPTVVSADEIERFAKLYPMNARPVQPLNGREVNAGG